MSFFSIPICILCRFTTATPGRSITEYECPNSVETGQHLFIWFNYGPADGIVNYALSNGMKVKGHCLVWHMQLPDWVKWLGTADAVRNAMQSHINNLINHYKGKVYAWDVVNEAVETDSDTGDGHPRMRRKKPTTA